jgi:hypothetical protein
MDRQTIDDQHVVARYLADQLSDADREAFEGYCREHPEVYRELEAAARVKVGLAKLGETGRLEGLVNAPSPKGIFAYRYAAGGAGVLAVGAALVASFVMMQAPMMGANVAEVSGRFGADLPVAATYEFLRMRESTEFDQKITLPLRPAVLKFEVLPDNEGASKYRATLSLDEASGSRVIARADGLAPLPSHYVVLFVSSEKLVPGSYSLVVEPEDGSEKEPAFRFEVRQAP